MISSSRVLMTLSFDTVLVSSCYLKTIKLCLGIIACVTKFAQAVRVTLKTSSASCCAFLFGCEAIERCTALLCLGAQLLLTLAPSTPASPVKFSTR